MRTQLILIVLLLLPLFSFGDDSLKEGKNAFLNGEYQKAIELFTKVLEQDPENEQALFYLGDSNLNIAHDYLAEKKFEEAEQYLINAQDYLEAGYRITEKSGMKRKFLDALQETNNGLDVIRSSKAEKEGIGSSSFLLYLIIGIVVLIGLIILLFFNMSKDKSNQRQYKEHTLDKDLTDNIESLNGEYQKAKTIIVNSNNEELVSRLEDIEERCIALNDRIETSRYGLLAIEQETLKDEIDVTKEMIQECLSQVESVTKE